MRYLASLRRHPVWLAVAIAMFAVIGIICGVYVNQLLNPAVSYDAAVFGMLDPFEQSEIQMINSAFEPFPGFPYFSRESDHPTYWPPQVIRDRKDLSKRILGFLTDPEIADALKAIEDKLSDDSTFKVVSSDPADPSDTEWPMLVKYTRLRMLLNVDLKGDMGRAEELIGKVATKKYQRLEEFREYVRERQPNRILIVRARNRSKKDIQNLQIEINCAGSIYDATVNGNGEGIETFDADPSLRRIVIGRMPPSYAVEVRLWYRYLSVQSRVFPDERDFELEKTQGLTIRNVSISNGSVRKDKSFTSNISAYRRFDVEL